MIGGYYHDNPFEGILGGYVTGLNIKRTQDQNKYLQAEETHKMSAMQALQGLDFNDENAVRQFVARYPEYGKGAKDYIAGLDEKRQRALLADMTQTIALLQNKRSDLAVKRLKAKAQAFRNSGDEKTALEYEEMVDWIGQDSTSAYNGLVMSYATLTDKDSAGNYKAVIEANRPTTDFKNAGDRFVPVTTDPITGEVSTGGYDNINIGVSPDAQVHQNTAIITTGMNNETSRYVSDNSRAASEYGADKSYQGTVYASDNNLKGTIYSADKGYAGTVYSTDGSIQRAQIEAVSRERIEQAKLYYQQQQDEIRNNQAEIKELNGQVFIVYKNGDFKVALDENGQPMTASPARREEKQRIQKVETLLGEIEKILPNSTNSWLGTGVDMAANAFGVSTKGATATAQLQTLSGQLVSLMPRMNGPQSDKDVLLYKEMAGKLADSTIPVKQRQAALATIRQLNQKYAEINGTPLASQSTKQPLSYYFTGE